MDIELSRIIKDNAGYQKLAGEDNEIDTPAMSTRPGKSYNKKGKGKAKYVDEPEDEVDLLRESRSGEYADDEVDAELGHQPTLPKPPERRQVCIFGLQARFMLN